MIVKPPSFVDDSELYMHGSFVRATVVEFNDIWYKNDGALTRLFCENSKYSLIEQFDRLVIGLIIIMLFIVYNNDSMVVLIAGKSTSIRFMQWCCSVSTMIPCFESSVLIGYERLGS